MNAKWPTMDFTSAVKAMFSAVLAGLKVELGWTKCFSGIPEFVPTTWAD